MCGLAGWIDWSRDLTDQALVVEHMADVQSHRGPDQSGSWHSSHAALAHRRLIVIDPNSGPQPMIYGEGNSVYALIYNGEIYNFRELRHELEQLGHTFHTQTDTEVLLHSYLEWDEQCPLHLNGIFAFGLWDEARQRLLLVRDRLGVKPLYYAQRGSAIIFGSELKALLAHPLVKPEVDLDGLATMFLHQPGSSGYRDVHAVRPGYMILFERDNSRTIQYWSLHSKRHTDDLTTTEEHIRSLLRDIVKRQLVADVPVVTLLSGGLDSSGITALAGREFQCAGKVLNSYSIDYVDSTAHFHGHAHRPSLDAPWAQRVSEHVGTQHQRVLIDTPELIENLLVPMRAHDWPGIGQLETSMYLLFKAIKQNATVGISGEAADELFGGYHWFHNEIAINTQTFPWLADMGREGGYRAGFAWDWISKDLREKMQLDAYIAREYQEALAEVPHLEGEDVRGARMREIFHLNMTRFLPVLLELEDRMSMATGFEVRVPFCDHRLIEYIWNIPWAMKNVDNIEKGILRRAFADILPDDARKRTKSAYPTSQNPSYPQAVRTWVSHILADTKEPVHALIDPMFMHAVVDGNIPHLPDETATTLCERVIQINSWLEEYHVVLNI